MCYNPETTEFLGGLVVSLKHGTGGKNQKVVNLINICKYLDAS